MKCLECHGELNNFLKNDLPNSCTHEYVVINKDCIYRRERFYSKKRTRCPSCHISLGGVHHFGCVCEVCPVCLGSMIDCSCNVTGIIRAKTIHEAEASLTKIVPAQHK